MTAREDFVYALEKLAKKGDIDTLNDFYSPELAEEDRKFVETALVEAIKTAARKGKGHVLPILRRDDVTDGILLEAMEACRNDCWQVEPIANILREQKKSDEVMLKAVEICGENGRVSALRDALGRKDLSEQVMIKIAVSLAEKGWGSHVSMFLLSRKDVSEKVKEAARNAIERAKIKDAAPPKDAVRQYLEEKRNRIGGDGVLSERTGQTKARKPETWKPQKKITS